MKTSKANDKDKRKSATAKTAGRAKPALPVVSPEGQPPLEEQLAQLSRTNRQLRRKVFDLYTIFEIQPEFQRGAGL
jgi:hypothetical protein